jgi:hypothetical protein
MNERTEVRARVEKNVDRMLTFCLLFPGSEFPNESDPKADVSGLSGQEILLPCSVDVNACGDFHSIKWYRGGQRIFVFSELANLERSEGFLSNRSVAFFLLHSVVDLIPFKPSRIRKVKLLPSIRCQ